MSEQEEAQRQLDQRQAHDRGRCVALRRGEWAATRASERRGEPGNETHPPLGAFKSGALNMNTAQDTAGIFEWLAKCATAIATGVHYQQHVDANTREGQALIMQVRKTYLVAIEQHGDRLHYSFQFV